MTASHLRGRWGLRTPLPCSARALHSQGSAGGTPCLPEFCPDPAPRAQRESLDIPRFPASLFPCEDR